MNLGDTATVLNPGTATDAYGNTTQTWDTPDESVVSAWVGPQRTTEALAAGDLFTSTLLCLLPPDAPVTDKSRIRWRGDDYDIDGQAQPVMRRGVLHHYELTLRKVTG